MPEVDDKDRQLIADRQRRRDALKGPRIGDFVRMPDGTLHQFTYDWDDSLQTTKAFTGSFHSLWDGHVSYSGGMDHGVPKDGLTLLPETLEGRFWIFHHDHAEAHNGVDFTLPCRVFAYAPKEPS